jgi:hypothetical protein
VLDDGDDLRAPRRRTAEESIDPQRDRGGGNSPRRSGSFAIRTRRAPAGGHRGRNTAVMMPPSEAAHHQHPDRFVVLHLQRRRPHDWSPLRVECRTRGREQQRAGDTHSSREGKSVDNTAARRPPRVASDDLEVRGIRPMLPQVPAAQTHHGRTGLRLPADGETTVTSICAPLPAAQQPVRSRAGVPIARGGVRAGGRRGLFVFGHNYGLPVRLPIIKVQLSGI